MECHIHPLRSLVFGCLSTLVQVRGTPGPTLETTARLGTAVTFCGLGPMVCLELSGLHVQSFAHKKLARLSEVLEYTFPSWHSGHACGLHWMSEVASVEGFQLNGRVVTKGMRMTLLSPVALCRLLPCLARLPSYKKSLGCTGASVPPSNLCP